MLSLFSKLRDITSLSVLFRLLLATFLGALIGLERSYKNRPAGFRTHMLVSIGSACACMTGHFLYQNLLLPADVSRIASSVVTGLGFIGAGTIIVTNKQTVKGLTTAAGLWTCGIIGLSVGAGFYEGGLIATGLVLATELIFGRVGHSLVHHAPPFTLLLQYDHTVALDQVMRHCKNKHMVITNLRITSEPEVSPDYIAHLTLRPNKGVDHDRLLTHIQSISGIVSVEEL